MVKKNTATHGTSLREMPNEEDLSGKYNLYFFDKDQKNLIKKHGEVTPLRHLFWDEKIPKASLRHLTYDLGQYRDELGDRPEFYHLCRTLMRPQEYLKKFYGEDLRYLGYERSIGSALKYQIFLHVQSGSEGAYTDEKFSDRVAWDTLVYGKLWRQDVIAVHALWLAKKDFFPYIYHLLTRKAKITVDKTLTWYWKYNLHDNIMDEETEEERKEYLTRFREMEVRSS